MVLDTDTYNEIDDQFAVVYSLISPEKLDVEAIYAAPFFNTRSLSPKDGMEKSYEEISEILDIPLGTVKIRIHRAREKLKSILEEQNGKQKK